MGEDTPEYFDVLVVGAGLSGIGAAYRLQTMCPDKSYAILEARDAIGGTWDLFRYPGVRSDSDMFTLGYSFHPWRDAKAIADGPSILNYVRETATHFGIDRRIRFNQRVVSADWLSDEALWRVTTRAAIDLEHGQDGKEGKGGKDRKVAKDGATVDTEVEYRTRFLYLCSGYYSYESGYRPHFPDEEAFEGKIIHPQQWPDDLDYAGMRVVVIGSGATAVTLLPSMAPAAAHVTMLQRSPSYIASLPGTDPMAERLSRVLPLKLAHTVLRWKNAILQIAFYQLCQRRPEVAKKILRAGVLRHLPPDYPIDPDFSPRYEPWDQRMCLAPDADIFRALRSGKASVVTDEIERFTSSGMVLRSGAELEADLVVAATGLRLVPFGNIRLSVDQEHVDAGRSFIYKGFMVSGVPNFALCFGYTNASWTLRADLTSRSVCRLLRHMDKIRATSATPVVREDRQEAGEPLYGLTSGYVMRTAADLPKQASKAPWRMRQNYLLDYADARFGRSTEGLVFANPRVVAKAAHGESQ